MATTDRLLGISGGAALKTPVVVASTGNLTLSGAQTVDGISVGNGERVLVKSQTSSTDNGIYDTKATAWTRSKDFNGDYDAVPGTLVYVDRGTANSDSFWVANSSSTATKIAIGATEITWSDITGTFANDGSNATVIATGSTTARALEDRFADVINVKDCGALGDGVTDDAAAFDLSATRAGSTGSVVVPNGSYVVNLTSGNIANILASLDRMTIYGDVTMNLPTGTTTLTSGVLVAAAGMDRLSIKGAAHVTKTLTSQQSVSGSAKGYSVILNLGDVSGITVNDYAVVIPTGGTNDWYAHFGMWKITNVDSGNSRITVLNTHHGAAFPTNTITGGSVHILTSILKFSACEGIRVQNGYLGLLQDVAIVGDYDVQAATGTTGTHGINIGEPDTTGDSNAPVVGGGGIAIEQYVGVSGFGEQGIAIANGGAISGNYLSSCSNRKRGVYASWGGSARMKFAMASGNGEDGFIADYTSSLEVAISVASGNGINGFWATSGGYIQASTPSVTVASGNLAAGFEARGGGSRISCNSALSLNNGTDGFLANGGGFIDADSATADGNGDDGFDAVTRGIIEATGSTSKNNSGHGYSSDKHGWINANGATLSGNVSGDYLVGNMAYIEDASGAQLQQLIDSGAELTISSGAITVTHRFHRVDTEGDAASDDLTTINGGVDGDILVLAAANSARTVVVKDGLNTIRLSADFSLDHTDDRIYLQKIGNNWHQLSQADIGT